MRLRSALSSIVVGAFVLSVVALDDGDGTAGPRAEAAPPSDARAESVTVRGTFERLVVETADGENVRYAVHGTGRSWWLEGVRRPAPSPGSLIEVTGTRLDDHTLAVDEIDVLESRAQQAVSAAAPSSTQALVIRVYWTASPPAEPTTQTTQQRTITDSRAWFGEVSHGRYAVSGTVTRWLKIARPSDCYQSSFVSMDRALAAAQNAGYRPSTYGRIILYLPCSAGGVLGLGSMPGAFIWLYGTLATNVLMHEQGHNLGLPHASSRACDAQGWGSVTWSRSCQVSEYGDTIDSMGNRRAGHFNAYYKSRLGWLLRSTTVSSTRTVRLTSFETSSGGYKAIRLRASSTATYWLELRTRTGLDTQLAPGSGGVQIRYQSNGATQLLDASPEDPDPGDDFHDVHLPNGSSWTTPQQVRIAVVDQSAAGATVAITFNAGAPTAPGAPRPVSVQPLVRAARITWTRPGDGGSIIRRYTITRSGDGASRTMTTTGGTSTSYTWDGLDPTISYTFAVRAVSQAGTSRAATSPTVRPHSDAPSVVIDSPTGGTSVQGIVSVRFTPSRNPHTNTPLSQMEFEVDGNTEAYDTSLPWGPFDWDTRTLPNGPYEIAIRAYDQLGRSATTRRTVTVSNPARTATITTPSQGASVFGSVDVAYSLSPTGWDWEWVELLVDGTSWTSANPGDPLSFRGSDVIAGAHTVRVRATDARGAATTSPSVSVNVVHPTVAITSPSNGATLSDTVDVTYALAPAQAVWDEITLYVDGSWAASTTEPGAALSFDTAPFGAGERTLVVQGYSQSEGWFDSEPVVVTFTD